MTPNGVTGNERVKSFLLPYHQLNVVRQILDEDDVCCRSRCNIEISTAILTRAESYERAYKIERQVVRSDFRFQVEIKECEAASPTGDGYGGWCLELERGWVKGGNGFVEKWWFQ